MYHFKPTEHAPETTILNEHTELSGRAIKFLKDFQISAVRFLFEQYCKRNFCILNDESGLGKTASVAVFLGIVAVRKNCLIVVANNDESVTGWRFHFDILTDLKVNVLNKEKDYDATDYSVYIVKWNALRSINDLNKIHFDLIVVDNREHILSNSFCISNLLKNFEKKVQLVISSVDVTSDVKLMHNILRLGGRLEHHLESFKAFEQKFKLPDLKAISSKKCDLEDYFVRREILNDYCRDFRLRRYRHQIETTLPLVDPICYKTFLNEWLDTTVNKNAPTKAALLIGEQLPNEINTEELLEHYQTNPESFDALYGSTATATVPVTPAIKSTSNTTTSIEVINEIPENNASTMPTALDITDDLMEMPPLIFVTDSEHETDDDDDNEEEDVIFLSSESAAEAAAAMPVIEIEEEEVEIEMDRLRAAENSKTVSPKISPKIKSEKLSPQQKAEALKAQENLKAMNTKCQNNKRKSTTPQQLKKHEKSSEKNAIVKEQPPQHTTPRTRSKQQSEKRTTRKRFSSNEDKVKNAENSTKKTATKTATNVKRKASIKNSKTTPTLLKKGNQTAEALKIKAEKLTPKKNDARTTAIAQQTKTAQQNLTLKIERSSQKQQKEAAAKEVVVVKKTNKVTTTPTTPTTPTLPSKSKVNVEEAKSSSNSKINIPKTPKNDATTQSIRCQQKRLSTPLTGVPLRATRNMQRNTRSSGGKRKCFALDFDDDHKKTKAKAKPKQNQNISTDKEEEDKKPENVAKTTPTNINKQKTRKTSQTTNQNSLTHQQHQQKQQQKDTKATTKTTRKSLPTTLATKKAKETQKKEQTSKAKSTSSSTSTVEEQQKNLASTQSSVLLPMSSDYEEIQCGQKLVYSSSIDNSPQPLITQQKPNEFLMPSTPPSYRASQFSFSHLQTGNDSDSDVAILLPRSMPPPPSSSSASQKRRNKAKSDSVVMVYSSSQDEASLSSQASSSGINQCQHRRARSKTTTTAFAVGTQKRKRYSKRISLPTTTTTNTTKEVSTQEEPLTFGVLLAKQRKNTKSPDLFSIGSDAGILTQGSRNNLPFTQPNNNGQAASMTMPPTTTTSPIFGFKIFGSEVRSFHQQQQQPSSAKTPSNISSDSQQLLTTMTTTSTKTRPTRASRSCLNILEQMFEKNAKATKTATTLITENTKAKELRKLRNARSAMSGSGRVGGTQNSASSMRKRPLINTKDSLLQLESESQQHSQPQPAPRKPIHNVRQQKQTTVSNNVSGGESDDIFEITNNATFGSTLRISASGHISPVTTTTTTTTTTAAMFSSNHNKITNYLIGNGGGNGNGNGSVGNEQHLLTTPKKRLQNSMSGSGGGVGGNVVVGTTNTNIVTTTTQTRKSPKSAKSTQTTKLTKWFCRSSIDDGYLNNKTASAKSTSDSNNVQHENLKSAKLVKRRRLDLSFKS